MLLGRTCLQNTKLIYQEVPKKVDTNNNELNTEKQQQKHETIPPITSALYSNLDGDHLSNRVILILKKPPVLIYFLGGQG